MGWGRKLQTNCIMGPTPNGAKHLMLHVYLPHGYACMYECTHLMGNVCMHA